MWSRTGAEIVAIFGICRLPKTTPTANLTESAFVKRIELDAN
jgi:hypothetical protein